MKLQQSATQVAQRTAALLRTSQESKIVEPTWYRTVLANPPTHQTIPHVRSLDTHINTKTNDQITSNGFYVTRNKQKFSTNAKHLYRIPKLINEADRIRHLFYVNHPWEMARPRTMVEKDGFSIKSLDWSTMQQEKIKLSGESVVQRTLYLSSQPEYKQKYGSDWLQAYEQSRLEFYRLRMREHAESAVAQEEAVMHGAVFGPNVMERFVNYEEKVIKKFEVDGVEMSREIESKRQRVEE